MAQGSALLLNKNCLMHNINISCPQNLKVNKDMIRTAIISTLSSRNIKSNAEVQVQITIGRKVHELTRAQKVQDPSADLFTFAVDDLSLQSLQVLPKVGLVISPDNYLKLGCICVSYHQALEDAALDGRSVDDEIALIVENGIKHLLGAHHD